MSSTAAAFLIGGVAAFGFGLTADWLEGDGWGPFTALFLSCVAWWPLAFGLFYVLTTTGVVA